MKDWPELVLSLIADLHDYCKWLDDFAEGQQPDIVQKIRKEQTQTQAMIDALAAHHVDDENPDLDRLLRWDHRFTRAS